MLTLSVEKCAGNQIEVKEREVDRRPINRQHPSHMTEWNESTLRGAASWKAFKEGKGLFEIGAVVAAKKTSDSWSGTVREGKRLFKVAVKVVSPTNLEARCGCVENQSTGAVCSHAVASGLAALSQIDRGEQTDESQSTGEPLARGSTSRKEVLPSQPVSKTAFIIGFPVNWQESFQRGKLALTLNTCKDEVTEADDRISAWLTEMGMKIAPTMTLNLDGSLCDAWIKAARNHPRVSVRKTETDISVGSPEVYSVPSPEKVDGNIRLKGGEPLIEIGNAWYRASDREIVQIGPDMVPGWLKRLLGFLGRGNQQLDLSMQDFLRQIGLWQEWVDFQEAEWLEAIRFVPALPSFEMDLHSTGDSVEVSLWVSYGAGSRVPLGLGEVESLPTLAGNRCEIRNWQAEREASDRMARSEFKSIDSIKWILRGEEAIATWLARELPELQSAWRVNESDRFKLLKKQFKVVDPSLKILGEGDDWLSFNLSFQASDGMSYSASDIRELLRSKRGQNNRGVVISNDVSSVTEPLFSELEIRQEGGNFIASKRAGEVIRELCKNLHNEHNHSDHCLKMEVLDFTAVQAKLRAYQTEGASWLVDRVSNYGGALLADDMGLGKTIQAIACINQLISTGEGAVVVVATASLLGNWRAELAKFTPHLKVRTLHGSGRELEQKSVESGDVLLTTYGTLPRDLAWYLKQKFRAIVVDEASLMRNPDTDHAKAISRLAADAKIALTGTPIENGVRDLWSIFRFIQPGWLGGREDFKNRYELSAEDPQVVRRLRLKTSPFMLRRTKEEVAPELPSKLLIEEYCDLTADQQSVYRDLLREGRRQVEDLEDTKNSGAARMKMLTALLRLRQASCDLALFENDQFKRLAVARRSAKLQRLLELLNEAISGGHKVLVFSQFQKQLREIEKSLNELEITSLRLDGQTKNRQELVDRFQASNGPSVFLISLKAGGYGLNLTAADTVIHFDPWWNPAAEAQATDRAHRIGQTRPVTVYRLIARGTVEEKVISQQNRKKRIAGAIDDSGGGEATGWSDQELKDLFNS